MARMFLYVLNLSLVGSWVILLVLLVRLLLRRSPRWCSYVLWGVVFLRLVLLVVPETGFSFVPAGVQELTDTMEAFLVEAAVQDDILKAHVDDDEGSECSGGLNCCGIFSCSKVEKFLDCKLFGYVLHCIYTKQKVRVYI